jgi:predicted enzyme related to lactoylglutathione lyase
MANARKGAVVWFEIPSKNFDRAVAFYETVLATKLKTEEMEGGMKISVFNTEKDSAGGCVMDNPKSAGGQTGTLIYLNAEGILLDAMGRVEKAGGKLLSPVVKLPMDLGSWIHIEDTEGNKIGLHSC